jgi:glycosyltransferase involved in cell wall biosynthesis
MKKNILLIMPNVEKGGIEKNLLLLTSHLVKNFDITLICGEISNDIKKGLDKNIQIIISKNFLKSKFFSQRIRNTINSFFEILKNKKTIVNKKTILFSLQNHPFPILLSKLIKKKIIIRIANHPYSSLRFFNKYPVFLFKLFVKIFFYRFTDGIICNSNSSRIYLKKFLKKNSITTIFNPIEFISNLQPEINRKNLLTIGRLENQKNISGIIFALKKVKDYFPNIKLNIVGSGSEYAMLRKLIEANNLNDNVEFKGYVNPTNDLLNSKILILNSFFEGMPNVLLEGLAYKIPIISTNCESGPGEILDNGKYGELISINNSKVLADRIIETMNNYDVAIKKAEDGYKSLDRFNKFKQLKKIEDYILSFC